MVINSISFKKTTENDFFPIHDLTSRAVVKKESKKSQKRVKKESKKSQGQGLANEALLVNSSLRLHLSSAYISPRTLSLVALAKFAKLF